MLPAVLFCALSLAQAFHDAWDRYQTQRALEEWDRIFGGDW
jgi:hypothetical protein